MRVVKKQCRILRSSSSCDLLPYSQQGSNELEHRLICSDSRISNNHCIFWHMHEETKEAQLPRKDVKRWQCSESNLEAFSPCLQQRGDVLKSTEHGAFMGKSHKKPKRRQTFFFASNSAAAAVLGLPLTAALARGAFDSGSLKRSARDFSRSCSCNRP